MEVERAEEARAEVATAVVVTAVVVTAVVVTAPAPATAAASRPPAHPPMGASTTGARTPRRWQNLVVRRVGGAMSVRAPWARDGDGSWAPTRRKHAVFVRGGGDRDETSAPEGYTLPSTARGARRDTDGEISRGLLL